MELSGQEATAPEEGRGGGERRRGQRTATGTGHRKQRWNQGERGAGGERAGKTCLNETEGGIKTRGGDTSKRDTSKTRDGDKRDTSKTRG